MILNERVTEHPIIAKEERLEAEEHFGPRGEDQKAEEKGKTPGRKGGLGLGMRLRWQCHRVGRRKNCSNHRHTGGCWQERCSVRGNSVQSARLRHAARWIIDVK